MSSISSHVVHFEVEFTVFARQSFLFASSIENHTTTLANYYALIYKQHYGFSL
jgi:hypothetical protein